MALVHKVTTPLFFSEREPYMFVFFVKEYESKFRTGACDNPHYMQVYDLRKIYPELSNVYEAKIRFVEEMSIGNHEPIKLYKFKIIDLTDGEHLSIRNTTKCSDETDFRVGVYDGNDGFDVAKRILNFCIEHKFYKRDD